MTGLEIALLLVGVLFFAGSFFFVEKLSSSDMETIRGMSEKELKILLEKQLEEASGKIDRTIESKYNESLNRFDRETNRRTTEEIYSISEHADSVRETLDEKINQMREEYETFENAHKEIVFLHNMLGDKQEKVLELEKEAEKLESNLRNMKKSVEDAIERLYSEQKIRVEQIREPEVVPAVFEHISLKEKPAEQDFSEASDVIQTEKPFEPLVMPQVKSDAVAIDFEETNQAEPVRESFAGIQIQSEGSGSVNEKILAMHREGFSDVDIAKTLGKGVGEIRLVLGLFDEGGGV